jgi:tRNA A37 threonylcarbamoyladenosine dehydratase
MDVQFSRTWILFGDEAMERLGRSHVAVFGVGGVGGYTVEALARSGSGQLSAIDPDDVGLSNINRQILATHSSLGMLKVEAARKRILDINPNAKVNTYPVFYTPETADTIDLKQFDYIIDAIDTVTAKLELIERAHQAGVPVISCMGTGNRLDPTMLQVIDLSKTSGCPLARVMRRELRKRGIEHLPVVCSREEAIACVPSGETKGSAGHPVPGSVSFVPPVAGMIAAGVVIRTLCGR